MGFRWAAARRHVGAQPACRAEAFPVELLPPANSRGLARRVESSPLGPARARLQDWLQPQDGPLRIGSRCAAARRRVEPAAGVSGRGATWTSFRLLVPGLALLGGRVHEAVPAALPQRVRSRPLRTGEASDAGPPATGGVGGPPPAPCGGPAAVTPWPRRSTWGSFQSNVPAGLALRMWSQAPWGRPPNRRVGIFS
jgi:hypothetical protein